MKARRDIKLALAVNDKLRVIAHRDKTVSLHGSDYINGEWFNLEFQPCQEHITILKKLVATLEQGLEV